jgi:hypothetical protein
LQRQRHPIDASEYRFQKWVANGIFIPSTIPTALPLLSEMLQKQGSNGFALGTDCPRVRGRTAEFNQQRIEQGAPMPHYMFQGNYTGEAIRALTARPEDRS